MSSSCSPTRFLRVASLLALAPAAAATACHHQSQRTLEQPGAHVQRAGRGEVRLRFPGVDVVGTRTGGFHIRILGGSVGHGDPLYVIDGNPMRIDPERGIDWFKPEDIAELRVLKHPSETAVHGPRGGNGVIIITTKQVPARRGR